MGLLKKMLRTVLALSALPETTKLPDLEWAFTKAEQHPETLLIQTIHSALSTLDVAIYSLTYPEIVYAIKMAKGRGVKVRIISDKHQSLGKSQAKALKILASCGVPIKINKHSGLMHLKVAIVDQKVVTTGSFNYSKAASTANDEVLMVIRKPEVAQSIAAQFELMWNDEKAYEALETQIAPTN